MSDSTRVAAIISAKDEADVIASTVRACRAIPKVDLVLVVDDGSEDDTGTVARNAGAVVVRHSVNRGKASAMETGGSVVAMRDIQGREPRLLLFVDADLGESATSCAALIGPVAAGEIDMTIGVPDEPISRGTIASTARRAIHAATGWAPRQPLSGQRCITREAFNVATPLSRGWGVEVGMSIDVLVAGFSVVELPCDIRHRHNDAASHNIAQYRDIMMAITSRKFRGARVPRSAVAPMRGEHWPIGEPFEAAAIG